MSMLRMPQVIALTGLSRMTVYRMESRGQFPRRVQLSPNSIGWRKNEVDVWLESRPNVALPGTPRTTERPDRSESRTVAAAR